MRLSEDRIYAIAEKAAERLKKRGMIASAASVRQIAAWIEKPILDNLSVEDEIDAEVRRYISGLSKPPPEGSFDYDALFRKKKEEISRRRGFAR